MVRRSLYAGLLTFAIATAPAVVFAQQPLAPAGQNITSPTPPTVPAAHTPNSAAPATGTAKPVTAKSAAAPATTSTTAVKKNRKHSKAKVAEPVIPIVQAPPPPPPSPEQSPAAAPQVNYQDGQLSIRSDNSTLGAILSAVKARTGATVEGPGVTSSDRIATQLGPGDPRDVLTTLLNGSKYDFILLGGPGSPASVQKIILSARANSGSSGATQNQQATARTFSTPGDIQQDPNQGMPDAEIPDDANQPEILEQPEQQPEPQPEPAQPPQQPQGIQPPPSGQLEGDQQQNPNQPKSPEQLLQELQRMQQQQQQNQPPK